MKQRWLSQLNLLNAAPGLLIFHGATQALFVTLAENLALAAEGLRTRQPALWAALLTETHELETQTAVSEDKLLRLYVECLQARTPRYNLSLKEEALYPHFKLTLNEAFPRLLVTRRVRADGAKYYGPFLPESGVRRLLDLANRLFKLRSCEVAVDGSWTQPCAEYYAQRCLAPCVAELCERAEYQVAVRAVDRLLAGQLPALLLSLDQDIAAAAGALDFEQAAKVRDLHETLAGLLTDPRWDLSLKKVSDVWLHAEAALAKDTDSATAIPTLLQLETVRAGKIIGEKTLALKPSFPFAAAPDLALPQVLAQWYSAYLPDRIFVPLDFAERELLAEALGQRAGRNVEISVVSEPALHPKVKLPAQQAVLNLQAYALSQQTAATALPELQAALGLAEPPLRIEAYDVAHLAGTAQVSGQAVAINGAVARAEGHVAVANAASEITALAETLRARLRAGQIENSLPNLVLLDGGRAHLKAVSQVFSDLGIAEVQLVAVVKPPRQRKQIAYLLTATNPDEPLNLPPNSAGWRLIQQVRDEAHRLANEAHRQLREAQQLAETAASLPGLNEKQRRLLLLNFGSVKRVREAAPAELAKFIGLEAAERLQAELATSKQQATEPLLQSLLVPVRLDDPLGDAADLRPIRSTDQEGRLLTERAAQKKGKRRSVSNPFALKRGQE